MKMHIGLMIILSMATRVYGVDSVMFTKTKNSYVKSFLMPDTVDLIPKMAPDLNNSEIRCSYAPMEMITKTWLDNNNKIFTDLNCDKNKFVGMRFTDSSCAMAIACSKSLLENPESKKVVDTELNEVLAKDYAKNSLDESLIKAERFEVLRAFAKEKYGLAGNQKDCPSKIDIEEGGKCNLKILDEVFVGIQTTCRFGKLCYQDEKSGKSVILGFRKFKEEEKENNPAESYLLDYQKYRVASKGKSAIQEDSGYIDNLSTFVTSDEFKKADSDKKAVMFLEHLKKGLIIDPVLGFELDSDALSVDKEKLLKLKQFVGMYENKKITKESFAKDFENYRKEHAQAILSGSGSCSDILSINKICKETTALSTGGVVGKHPTSIEKLSSVAIDSRASIAKIKSSLDGKFDEKYFDSLLNAQRCIAFDLVNQNQVNSNGTFFIRPIGTMRDVRDDTKDDLEFIPRATPARSSSLSSGWADEKSGPSSGAAAVKEGMYASDEASSSKPLAPIASVDQSYQNNFANSYADSFRQTPASEKEKTPETSIAPVIPANASNDEKVNDLMKRLAAAEDKVEKMKASNEEAENARVKQKKIDEEDALVKDLKNQITELKNTKKATVKPAVAEAQNIDSSRSSSSNNNFSIAPSNRVDSSSKVIPISDNYASVRNESGSTGATGSVATRSASQVANTGVALTANTSTDKGATAAVLTVDGMSSEKASETIFNRIIELKGVPFYIEESGMMKEIVPVMKDGKIVLDEKGNPVFEKIVKGRAGDKKFAKIKDKKRAPASITNVADLKRDEEDKLKVERVEYMKLKELTKGILDSNQ